MTEEPQVAGSKWGDLTARMVSGVVMLAVGLLAIWAGGHWFSALVAVLCGAMVWELVRIRDPESSSKALQIGLLAGAALLMVSYLPAVAALPLLLAAALVGYSQITQGRVIFAIYALLILLAGYQLILLREGLGIGWLLWLVGIVVVTDVAGYFAGRVIGGPKFWPRISPKKTWSGTVAGWIGAALVGIGYWIGTPAGASVVAISVAASFASQMGDIAESALKRRAGIKDSSALIPGHGGVLDRFDGMLGAAVLVLIVQLVSAFPPGPV